MPQLASCPCDMFPQPVVPDSRPPNPLRKAWGLEPELGSWETQPACPPNLALQPPSAHGLGAASVELSQGPA